MLTLAIEAKQNDINAQEFIEPGTLDLQNILMKLRDEREMEKQKLQGELDDLERKEMVLRDVSEEVKHYASKQPEFFDKYVEKMNELKILRELQDADKHRKQELMASLKKIDNISTLDDLQMLGRRVQDEANSSPRDVRKSFELWRIKKLHKRAIVNKIKEIEDSTSDCIQFKKFITKYAIYINKTLNGFSQIHATNNCVSRIVSQGHVLSIVEAQRIRTIKYFSTLDKYSGSSKTLQQALKLYLQKVNIQSFEQYKRNHCELIVKTALCRETNIVHCAFLKDLLLIDVCPFSLIDIKKCLPEQYREQQAFEQLYPILQREFKKSLNFYKWYLKDMETHLAGEEEKNTLIRDLERVKKEKYLTSISLYTIDDAYQQKFNQSFITFANKLEEKTKLTEDSIGTVIKEENKEV